MTAALAAAAEINALWQECLSSGDLAIKNCPTDHQVAEIIQRHYRDKQ